MAEKSCFVSNSTQNPEHMANTRRYQITFRAKAGPINEMKVTIQASDSVEARRIFQAQNPGCQIMDCYEVK